MSIGVAIVGGGIFAREQHLPAVRSCPAFELKAIYSRSLKSAKTLATDVDDVALYSDDSEAGNQYADLLARKDIQAVIIALPILVQPEFIRKSLLAGKHVLSEKPIAKDVAEAQQLIDWYRENIDPSIVTWSVAENYRYLAMYRKAEEVARTQGRVLGFRVKKHSFLKPGGKYFETEWRKTPEYQGGFLLDGGVHFVAALRMLLGDDAIVSVSAFTNLLRKHLPPVDTVDAALVTESGITGTFSASFGTSFTGDEWSVACEKGVVTLANRVVTLQPVDGDAQIIDYTPDYSSVLPEIRAWAVALDTRKPAWQASPQEALADLEVLENMLKSGQAKGEPVACVLQRPSRS